MSVAAKYPSHQLCGPLCRILKYLLIFPVNCYKGIDLMTKAGRVECQLILSKHLKGLTLGKGSVTITLQNDTEITIPTNPLPLNDGSPIFEIADKELLDIDAYQL